MFQKPLCDIYPHPPQGVLRDMLDEQNIPQHVAIIMDGNGRWAKKRAMNRLKGHKAGIEAVRETIRAARDSGVKYLTIYSFSTENWKRPQDEVDGLMNLFAKTMLAEVDELNEEDVCVKTIGDISILPKPTQEAFKEAYEKTCNNKGMTLIVALNYGARQEIVRGVQRLIDQGVDINEESISQALYTAGIPDPELLIRTSGEMRVSNFLLWQIQYSEFYSTDVLWPDFDRYEFLKALLAYQARNRRFGAL